MYNVTIQKNAELNFDQAGSIVTQVLQEDFEFLSKEIAELLHKRDMKPYEYEDLKNNEEMRNAMKALLRDYMTHRDYTEFMELQRVYGNVE